MLLSLNNNEEAKRDKLLIAPSYYESKEFFMTKLPEGTEVFFEESFIAQQVYADEIILRFYI
jgi:hypothetical protein